MDEHGDVVKIYRLEYEGEDGAGMYGYGPENSPCSEFSAAEQVFCQGVDESGCWDGDNHPSPRSDPLLCHLFDGDDSHQDYLYGFKGVIELLCWICGDDRLVGLHDCGIVLSVYKCPACSVVKGQHQCMFSKHLSKTQHNIIDFFHLQDCVDMAG